MSSTRHAEHGGPLRQERFASSAELERGLMGNLVAKRCEILEDPNDRALIWFLQLQSHAPGGLEKLCADVLKAYPDRLGTETMRRLERKSGIVPNDVAQTILDELDPQAAQRRRVSESRAEDAACSRWIETVEGCAERGGGELPDRPNHIEQKERPLPAAQRSYDFLLSKCAELANNLPRFCEELCLNPALDLRECAPPYFHALIETLREYQAAWIESKRAGQVVTELGRQVSDTLDYCLQGGCMVLIDGLARTGKSFSAKAWCELHPGQARIVQVPSTNDDLGFFRAIAQALGVSSSLSMKGIQMRERVETVLQSSRLMLVFDEAHYLWPQANCREALPGRVNWLMTALVNHGVPVGLVTTPQFMRSQAVLERKTAWTSEQFIGRIGHYQKLPDSLSQQDLGAVAKAVLPEGCAKSIETLVAYAQGSGKYLAGIELTVRRARFLAAREKRPLVTFADIRSAIKGSVIPSDTALAVALAQPRKAGRGRALAPLPQPHSAAPAAPVQPACQTPAPTVRRADREQDLAESQPLSADRARPKLAAA